MPGTRPVLMCLSSVQGREAQFTVCEGFTSHPELARGQFRSSDRTPAFSPSPSLRPVSSTAPRAGASVRAGPGPTLAAPRPGGDLKQCMVRRHASLRTWAGGRGQGLGQEGGWNKRGPVVARLHAGTRGDCHCLLGRAAPGAQGDFTGDRQALQHPGPVWLPELQRGQTQQPDLVLSEEGALSFQALGPASHGACGLRGTPSRLHLLLAQRCQGCEDGGAAGMGWPPRGCSRERPQDSVCARAVGGRGARVRGVQGGTTSTCNLGHAFPPATPPSSLPEPCRGVSGVWTLDAGAGGTVKHPCALPGSPGWEGTLPGVRGQ